MPLVVEDVDAAAETYRRLGFTIKPGRAHADGLTTRLIKLAQRGAGIELIHAPQSIDQMTADYGRLLAQGEGPAYVCFTTPDMGVLQARMLQEHEPYDMDEGLLQPQAAALAWLFALEGDNLSPTDRPEHFQHASTACTMRAVWIAGGDRVRMRAFFAGIGARIGSKNVLVPDPMRAEVAQLGDGEVIFLPGAAQIVPGRLIVGVSMGVRDLAAAAGVLVRSGIPHVERSHLTHPAVFVAPRDTHNMWLELRQEP